jgi:hypothetical protein
MRLPADSSRSRLDYCHCSGIIQVIQTELDRVDARGMRPLVHE